MIQSIESALIVWGMTFAIGYGLYALCSVPSAIKAVWRRFGEGVTA